MFFLVMIGKAECLWWRGWWWLGWRVGEGLLLIVLLRHQFIFEQLRLLWLCAFNCHSNTRYFVILLTSVEATLKYQVKQKWAKVIQCVSQACTMAYAKLEIGGTAAKTRKTDTGAEQTVVNESWGRASTYYMQPSLNLAKLTPPPQPPSAKDPSDKLRQVVRLPTPLSANGFTSPLVWPSSRLRKTLWAMHLWV